MRKFTKNYALLCGLMISVSPIGISAAVGETYLDEITVTSTRTPQKVIESPRTTAVVSREELDNTAPQGIAEKLRDMPGVDVADSAVAGMKRIRIRGEFSSRVTILIDGQEVTDHSTYGTPLLIDPASIERIDVIRGPSSVLYGSKAIGGVINIITKKGGSKPLQAEITGSYFSATKGHHLLGSLYGAYGGFDYRISGGFNKHGDRDVPGISFDPSGKLTNSGYKDDNLMAHLGYRFGKSDNHYVAIKLQQTRLNSDAYISPSNITFPTTSFFLDLPKRDRRKVGFFYDGKDISPLVKKVHFDAYYQTIEREFLNAIGLSIPITPPFVFNNMNISGQSKDRITDWGGTAQIDLKPHKDHYFITGAQFLSDGLNTTKTSTTSSTFPFPSTTVSVNNDVAKINTYSVFAQDEWSFAEHFKFTGGMRYYHIDARLNKTTRPTGTSKNSDDKILGSAGLTFTGVENTTFRGLFSQGYVYPSLLQLFVPTTAAGFQIAPNSSLKPETSNNFEVGARFDNGTFVADLSAYYTMARNYITTVNCTATTCAPGFGFTDVYDNINKATTYGVELQAEYNFEDYNLKPYVSAAWIRRKFKFANFSTFNSNTPALSARYGIKHKWELGQYMHGWADIYARSSTGVKSTNSSGATEKLSGWTTLNFSVGANIGSTDKYQVLINFKNLTNKAYRATIDELPGAARSVDVTARIKL